MGISKPVVFISHSVYDKNIALILKNNIADYIRGSLEIFVSSDSQSLRGGERWFEKIENFLKKADIILVLLSQKSVKSQWVYFEVGGAEFLGKKIIPIILNVTSDDIGPLNRTQYYRIKESDIESLFDDISEISTVTDLNEKIDFKALIKEITGELRILYPTIGIKEEKDSKVTTSIFDDLDKLLNSDKLNRELLENLYFDIDDDKRLAMMIELIQYPQVFIMRFPPYYNRERARSLKNNIKEFQILIFQIFSLETKGELKERYFIEIMNFLIQNDNNIVLMGHSYLYNGFYERMIIYTTSKRIYQNIIAKSEEYQEYFTFMFENSSSFEIAGYQSIIINNILTRLKDKYIDRIVEAIIDNPQIHASFKAIRFIKQWVRLPRISETHGTLITALIYD